MNKARTVAFFNNKGGVGKTSLVYHLAWMYAEKGIPVLAVDLDPQSNLTSMFLEEEKLEILWGKSSSTVSDCLRPLVDGSGGISPPHVEIINDNLGLVLGNLALSRFEDELSTNWSGCLDRKPRSFLVTTAFHQIITMALKKHPARIVFIDVGPNLGAINRSALIASESVVVPLAPDLFSLQGLKNLGPTLREWRRDWDERRQKAPQMPQGLTLPGGEMHPIGYIVMQHSVKEASRPVKAYERWIDKIPSVYRESVLAESIDDSFRVTTQNDPHNIALLKHYRSLMPLAMEAHKPIFHLKPADGAIGAHAEAVASAYEDFRRLEIKISAKSGAKLDLLADTSPT